MRHAQRLVVGVVALTVALLVLTASATLYQAVASFYGTLSQTDRSVIVAVPVAAVVAYFVGEAVMAVFGPADDAGGGGSTGGDDGPG